MDPVRPGGISPDAAAPEGSGRRRSACAAAARRREAERIAAMSPRERMLLALELGERYAALAEARK